MDCIHESAGVGNRCQCSLFMVCLIWVKRWQTERSDETVQCTRSEMHQRSGMSWRKEQKKVGSCVGIQETL